MTVYDNDNDLVAYTLVKTKHPTITLDERNCTRIVCSIWETRKRSMKLFKQHQWLESCIIRISLRRFPYKHTTWIPCLNNIENRFKVEYTWCICMVGHINSLQAIVPFLHTLTLWRRTLRSDTNSDNWKPFKNDEKRF